MHPSISYYFYVVTNKFTKNLYWEDDILNQDPEAAKLRELIKLITKIVLSKSEYKNLPKPRGGYS